MANSNRMAVEFAEHLVSPGYRQALDSAFDSAPEKLLDQRVSAEQLIFEGMRGLKDKEQQAWEIRRLALMAVLKGADLGTFNEYIQNMGGSEKPAELTLLDLAAGQHEIVKVNSKIKGAHEIFEEPIDFLEEALVIIDARPEYGKRMTGPENYATALKYFTDKFRAFPSSHLSHSTIKTLIDEAMDGFVTVTEDDKPNFVEMTNVYYAIRGLPRAVFDQRFTRPLLFHSIEQMPDFNTKTLSLMLAAVSKLDLSTVPADVPGSLVDLALRKGRKFETTQDFRSAMRAIANLPPHSATNQSFATFLRMRNNLEEPLDLEGADESVELLGRIVDNSINDKALTLEAKNLAYSCTQRAIRIVHQDEQVGDITLSQLKQRKDTIRRIIGNYSQI